MMATISPFLKDILCSNHDHYEENKKLLIQDYSTESRSLMVQDEKWFDVLYSSITNLIMGVNEDLQLESLKSTLFKM